MAFDNNLLSIKYDSFSCGFHVEMGLDVNLCVEYQTFNFDPIIIDLLLDPPESTFVEFETFVLDTPCLDQILDDNETDRLKDHFEMQDLTLGHPLSLIGLALVLSPPPLDMLNFILIFHTTPDGLCIHIAI